MAQVSLSEAAKLTGKNRTTLYRYIQQGKLSKITDATGKDKLDTSELLRVFGAFNATVATTEKSNKKQHDATKDFVAENATLKNKIQQLEQQLKNKEDLLHSKDDHITSLKQAMLLLERKSDTNTTIPKKRWQFWRP